MTMKDWIDELRERCEGALKDGGEDRIASQHDKGKMTAREYIDYFLDDGTFREFDQFRAHRNHRFGIEKTKLPGSGVITGYSEVGGRTVFVFVHDFTVFDGSLGGVFTEKVCKVMGKAMEVDAPVIDLNDSADARIQEDVQSPGGFGEIFRRNTETSDAVPQISIIVGPCAGGVMYSLALTDFTFMVRNTSHMFITDPDVIKTVTGEEVTFDKLGGATTRTSTSGAAHFATDTGEQALDDIRHLLSYLPQNNVKDPPRAEPWDDPGCVDGDLARVVPDQPRKPCDIHDVLDGALDRDSFSGVQEDFAKNTVVGFGRLDGHSVGIVTNQPHVNAGTLNISASEKGARFIRLYDSFNIPVLTFVDVPSFLPGTNQEYNGIIRHGTRLLYTYSEAAVPLMTVITRKAYGGAYDAVASKHLGADVNYAWPIAEIAVMGPQGAINILYRDGLDAVDDPDARHDELIEKYREEFASPYTATDRGFIDNVVEPGKTRERPISDLWMLNSKHKSQPNKKHGNIPL